MKGGLSPISLTGLLLKLVRTKSGGGKETRTPDPLLAKQMLYQLSYAPLKQGGGK